ncbi:MAG: hypothetical protein L3K16_03155 [Thermoplasmata archaeon]|nr:hypothetical protein [Thermoplasmata archaeon]
MTPKRRKWVVVAAVAAAVGVGVVLVVLSFPIAQEGSGDQLVNGRLYSFEAESLFGGPPWQNYSYLGVTFGFHLWCAINPAAGLVCGNATASGGPSYPYGFWDRAELNPSWQTWVSPNGHDAVEYRTGGLVHLLVEG